jgi:hypothetical protein
MAACSGDPTSSEVTGSAREPSAASETGPVLVGAGDIGDCGSGGDEITAALLDEIDGTVFTLGDNAYPKGTASQFANCYGPSWGRHKDRTRPSPGNHDYATSGAQPYYDYFGSRAGPSGKGYYSYDLGTWHIVSLNSNIQAGNSSQQAAWLRSDLAAHPTDCTLAYWHHAVFSSGKHGPYNPKMANLWRILDAAGVDVVLAAHDHLYERFAPQDADGRADPSGIRQFVVGTGGGETLYPVVADPQNLEVRDNTARGVLKLTLHPGGYEWEFVPQPGRTFADAGSAACVEMSSGGTGAPTADAGGPYTGKEGSIVTFDGSASTDPEGGSLSYLWSYSDGGTASGASTSRSFPDNGGYTATLEVTDSDGLSDAATASVTVTSVKPKATFVAPGTAPRNTAFVISLTSPTDPSPEDTEAGFTYRFDCGSGFAAWTSSTSRQCPGKSSLGQVRVRGKIRDKDNAVTTYRKYVQIVSN